MYIQNFRATNTFRGDYKEQLSPNIKSLVQQTLQKLYQLQLQTQGKIDFSKTFEYESYDELPVIHDLYYFKNFVADFLELEYNKSTLLKEFKKLQCSLRTLNLKEL